MLKKIMFVLTMMYCFSEIRLVASDTPLTYRSEKIVFTRIRSSALTQALMVRGQRNESSALSDMGNAISTVNEQGESVLLNRNIQGNMSEQRKAFYLRDASQKSFAQKIIIPTKKEENKLEVVSKDKPVHNFSRQKKKTDQSSLQQTSQSETQSTACTIKSPLKNEATHIFTGRWGVTIGVFFLLADLHAYEKRNPNISAEERVRMIEQSKKLLEDYNTYNKDFDLNFKECLSRSFKLIYRCLRVK